MLRNRNALVFRSRPYPYNAILFFTKGDQDFVSEVFSKGLECYFPFFHFFTFNQDIWVTEAENKVRNALADSQKAIVLLTRQFLCDRNSMRLLMMAASFWSEDSCRRIIIVTKEDLPPASQMSSYMTALMKSCSCLRWGQSFFWKKLISAFDQK